MGRWLRAIACLLCVLCLPCLPSDADELKLRYGTKIIGKIVGFEDNHFKVETPYGFALVRRDKVASITMTEEKKNSTPAKKSAEAVPPPQSTPATTSAAPPAAPPAAAPAPRVREEVEGNTYTNHLYGFRLYKPPSWQVIEGAHRTLPNAVVAMGTGDETTLLVVGREPMRGSLDAQASATERRLREIYENYRALGDEKTTVAGQPALARRFRGTVEGHDWSGRVVWVAHGGDLFMLFGMTYADSDLIQIQENVIAKTIASLEFIR